MMQAPTTNTALISWKERHRISDSAFEELLMMQAVTEPTAPSANSWTASTAWSAPEPSSLSTRPMAPIWPADDTTGHHTTSDLYLGSYAPVFGANAYDALAVPALDIPMLSTAAEHSTVSGTMLEQDRRAPLMMETGQMPTEDNLDWLGAGQMPLESYLRQDQDMYKLWDNSTLPTIGTLSWSMNVQQPNLEQGVAEQSERQIQHTVPAESKSVCARCWVQKRKCDNISKICLRCSSSNLPAHLCVRARILDQTVFSKWNNSMYGSKLTWKDLVIGRSSSKRIQACHFRNGPVLAVECVKFIPQNGDESILFYKSHEGWSSMMTTPYALGSSPLNIEKYVESHAVYLVDQVAEGSWLSRILSCAQLHKDKPEVSKALCLWAAHQLLMKGWELTSPGTLGMSEVTDPLSVLCGTVPAPRVLQNQLDRILEQYCANAEAECLKGLQKLIITKRSCRVAIYTVIALLLHIRERDIWRLSSWIGGRNSEYKWRHPDSAKTLIRHSVYASNVLLSHVHHFSTQDDHVPKELKMEDSVMETRTGQAYQWYNWLDDSSLDHSLCSIVFMPRQAGRNPIAQPEFFGC